MEKKTKKIIGATVGLAAVAAAAGAYFFAGKRGAKNRQKVADWASDMKEEVLERLKHLKDVNRESYEKLVDDIAARYRKTTKISASEIKFAAAEIKKAWSHIQRHASEAIKDGAVGKA